VSGDYRTMEILVCVCVFVPTEIYFRDKFVPLQMEKLLIDYPAESVNPYFFSFQCLSKQTDSLKRFE